MSRRDTDFRWRIIDTIEDFDSYLETLSDDPIVYDTETTSLNPLQAKIIIHVIYQRGGEVVCVFEDFQDVWDGVPTEYCREKLSPILTENGIVAHNASYDCSVVVANGYPMPKVIHDTQNMAHLIDPDLPKNLEQLVEEFCRYKKKPFKKIIGKNWDKIDWKKDTKISVQKQKKKSDPIVYLDPIITKENLGEYAAEDGYYTDKLLQILEPLLLEWKLEKIYYNIEIPLIEVLVGMKLRGVLIDKSVLVDAERSIQTEMEQLVESIYEQAGTVFNVNSGKQKAEVLFDHLGLPEIKKTASGARSTDSDTMKELANKGYEIAKTFIRYANVSKIYSTYAVGMQKMIENDGRIRANFNATGSRTGRFSSSNPNLQNIATDDEFGIRKAFITSVGRKLIVCDYSAQEYAITAHACKDENMLSVFERGEDIHQWVADNAGVTRKQAKGVGFGILYGLSVDNLAALLGVSSKEAQKLIDKYFGAFPKLRPWIEKIKKSAIDNLYIRTPVGSIRRFPYARKNKFERGNSERRAVNTCIQGSAAYQMKKAMVLIAKEFKSKNLDAHIIMQIHDELIVDCAEHCLLEVKEVVQRNMENAIPFKTKFSAVPIIVDNYGEGKDDSNDQSENYLNNNNKNVLWHVKTQMLLKKVR